MTKKEMVHSRCLAHIPAPLKTQHLMNRSNPASHEHVEGKKERDSVREGESFEMSENPAAGRVARRFYGEKTNPKKCYDSRDKDKENNKDIRNVKESDMVVEIGQRP